MREEAVRERSPSDRGRERDPSVRERQEGEPFGRDHHPGESEGAGRERREGEIRPGERGTRGER